MITVEEVEQGGRNVTAIRRQSVDRNIKNFLDQEPDAWNLPVCRLEEAGSRGNAYSGVIRFQDAMQPDSNQQFAKFFRVPGKDELLCENSELKTQREKYLSDICKMMFDYWEMPRTPSLIIEVTGGAHLEPTAELGAIEILQKNLVHAASSADAWIVTGGTHKGVMRLIGDEVARARRYDMDADITCLGIATWGMVRNREELVENVTTDDGIINYHVVEQAKEKDRSRHRESPLNSGHNYFLLYDNGCEQKYGQEVDFRSHLMAYIASAECCERNDPDVKKAQIIPHVLLVVDGGPSTFQTMLNAAMTKTPIVILTGFGGAADLIADLQEEMERRIDMTESNIMQYITEHRKYERVFSTQRTEQIPEKLSDFCRSAKQLMEQSLLTVVRSFESQSTASPWVLSDAILNAVFKVKVDQRVGLYMLELLRRWELPNTARLFNTIIADYNIKLGNGYVDTPAFRADTHEANDQRITFLDGWEQRIRNVALPAGAFDNLMRRALEDGQRDFVALLLKTSENAQSTFLTARGEIRTIYEMTLTENLDRKSKTREVLLLHELLKKHNDVSALGEMFSNEIGCFLTDLFRGTCNVRTNYRDMFLLQLALNRTELALFMWAKGKDLIGTALVGSLLLSGLAKLAVNNNFTELKARYEENAHYWEEKAKSLLQRCDLEQPHRVSWLLTRKLRTWQGRSVMDVAYFGQRKTFVECPAFQKKVSHIWHGRIIASTASPKIYFAILFFPIGFWWLTYIHKDMSNKAPAKPSRSSALSHSLEMNSATKKTGIKEYRPSLRPYFQKTEKRGEDVTDSTLRPALNPTDDDTSAIAAHEALIEVVKSCMFRFFWHNVFNAAFLFYFTAFILSATLETGQSVATDEIILFVWSLLVLIDIWQEAFGEPWTIVKKQNVSLLKRASLFYESYLRDRLNIFQWKKVDFYNIYLPMINLLLLLSAIGGHMAYGAGNHFHSRATYAVSCLIFWSRSLKIFYASHGVGIIAVTLTELIPTVFYFLLIYLCLLLSFSIPIYSLIPGISRIHSLTPVHDFFQLLVTITYQRWWNLVAVGMDATREEVERGYCENRTNPLPNESYCNEGEGGFNYLAVILYVCFILVANILWMNVLIASLSTKVEEIAVHTKKLTKFNHMTTTRVFYHKWGLPPPLNILSVTGLTHLLCYAYHRGRGRKALPENDFAEDFDDDTHLTLDEIERNAAEMLAEEERRENASVTEQLRMVLQSGSRDLKKLLLENERRRHPNQLGGNF